jgi:hypothetical protein
MTTPLVDLSDTKELIINEYSVQIHKRPMSIAGYWVLYPNTFPQTTFVMYKRPTDAQIKATEELLGWGWKDWK